MKRTIKTILTGLLIATTIFTTNIHADQIGYLTNEVSFTDETDYILTQVKYDKKAPKKTRKDAPDYENIRQTPDSKAIINKYDRLVIPEFYGSIRIPKGSKIVSGRENFNGVWNAHTVHYVTKYDNKGREIYGLDIHIFDINAIKKSMTYGDFRRWFIANGLMEENQEEVSVEYINGPFGSLCETGLFLTDEDIYIFIGLRKGNKNYPPLDFIEGLEFFGNKQPQIYVENSKIKYKGNLIK